MEMKELGAVRKLTTDWFTFQPDDDTATLHASKHAAVRDVQYSGDTERRPRKLTAGHYELRGCGGHQYWIVNQRIMQKQFPALMQRAYEDAE